MTQEFVNYNQALALKELGFDEPCFGFYSVLYDLMITQTNGRKSLFESECLAPLKQQVFRWFRDKHNIQGYIYPLTVEGYKNGRIFTNYIYSIKDLYKDIIESDPVNEEFENYEEAESACIDKLIEIVKKQIV